MAAVGAEPEQLAQAEQAEGPQPQVAVATAATAAAPVQAKVEAADEPGRPTIEEMLEDDLDFLEFDDQFDVDADLREADANADADAGSAGFGEEPTPELKRCTICLRDLPKSAYPVNKNGTTRGSTCTSDSDAAEALQRGLRRAWGPKEYKRRYGELKKAKAKWQQMVMLLALEEGAKGKKRRLALASEALKVKRSRIDERTLRGITEPMTWPHFSEHFQKPKHGGYSLEQLKAMWLENLQNINIEKDKKGTVGGVPNQIRCWVAVKTEKLLDAIDAEERSHEMIAKVGKDGPDNEEVEAILKGQADIGNGDNGLRDAIDLARGIDQALGFPLTPYPDEPDDASSLASGAGSIRSTATVSTTTSSASSVVALSASGSPSPQKPSQPDAKWARDGKGKISDAQTFLNDKIQELITYVEREVAEKIPAIRAEVLGPAGSESDEEKQELEVYLLVLESRVPIIPLMLATAGIGKLAARLEIEKDSLPAKTGIANIQKLHDILEIKDMVAELSTSTTFAQVAERKKDILHEIKLCKLVATDILKSALDLKHAKQTRVHRAARARETKDRKAEKQAQVIAKANARAAAKAAAASGPSSGSAPSPGAKVHDKASAYDPTSPRLLECAYYRLWL